MTSDSFLAFATRRAFEISYAVFRLASSMRDEAFSGHFKREALGLLSFSATGEYAKAQKNLNSLEYITRLGFETGAISMANGKILLAEISRFEESLNLAESTGEEPNLANFFAHDEGLSAILPDMENAANDFAGYPAKNEKLPDTRQNEENNPAIDWNTQENAQGIAENYVEEDVEDITDRLEDGFLDDDEVLEEHMNGIMKRYATILDYIHKNGRCRLKDLIEIMPGTSERTIRYDLKTMIDRGVLERVGSGGPFTYYKEKEGKEGKRQGNE